MGTGLASTQTQSDLRVEAEESEEAQESMPLLNIIPDVAEGCTPGPYEVPQVRGDPFWADHGNSAQRDGTAQRHKMGSYIKPDCL